MLKHAPGAILLVAGAACGMLPAGNSPSSAAGQIGVPRANTLVTPSAYVSLEPVPRSRTFEIAVVLKVREGFQVNAHEVYEGSVTVRMKVEALGSAPLGRQSLPLKVRYQACNEEAFFPPVNLPVTAELQVAERGAAARAVHAEIFSPRSR